MVKQGTILTNDPSMTAWGWVALDWKGNIIEKGCIKTSGVPKKKRRIRKGDDTVRRVNEINQELLKVIKQYKVDYILSELPHGSQNASAAVMIGIVTGIMQTLSDSLEIGIEWYSEGDAKKCVLGRQSATKGDMIEAINKLYDVHWTEVGYKDEAIADALAIHYVATKQSSTLKLLKK
jgi:Holliday junction resolvasome RuvABC endonuclease subunit